MIGKGVRITEGIVDGILDKCMKDPDHVIIWRRTCAQTVSIKGDRITMKTTVDKVHVLVANSTGITTTGKWLHSWACTQTPMWPTRLAYQSLARASG